MSPYTKPLKKITDLTPFFKDMPDKSKIFIGKTLEIRIPSKFSAFGFLNVSDKVDTIGIFDMIIDDEYQCALNMIANISMIPSDVGKFTYNGVDYTTVFLETNDVFMTSTTVLKDPNVIYCVWSVQVTQGRWPYFFDYKSAISIFKDVYELTGQGIGVSRSVFEGIIAHLSRDPDDIRKPYRTTNMTKPAKFVALNSISQATENTIARLNGSYMKNEGLTSALRYEVDQKQPFEDLLRGLNTAVDNHDENSIL